MLKNISNLKNAQELSKSMQKTIHGGASCRSHGECQGADQWCQYGRCGTQLN